MTALTGAVVAIGWLALAAAGGVTVDTVVLHPIAGAVGCGAAALVATLRPRSWSFGFEVPVLMIGLPTAAALAVDGHTALPLLAAVGICLLTAFPVARAAAVSLGVGAVGLGVTTVALVLSRGDIHAGVLRVEATVPATLLAAAGAAFVAAAALAPSQADGLRLLLVPGLVIGWVTAPLVEPAAVAAAALAVGATAARLRPAAVGLAALALAAAGGTRPAAALVGAAAVVIAALGPELGWPTVVPGAVATAIALAAGPLAVEPVAGGVAVAAAAVALAGSARGPASLGPGSLPAAAIGVWLTFAPATWGWVGGARLDDYQQGAARALAAGLLVTVVAWMTGQLRPPAPEWRGDGW